MPLVQDGAEHRPFTVLLVDDHVDVRDLIAEALRRAGYRVLVAGLPSEAIELAGGLERAPDLLLTDVAMPEMWGTDLARSIRAIHPKMQVLFMSGYGEVFEAAGTPAGVQDWQLLEKPFSLRSLETRIAEIVARGGGEGD